LSLYTRAETVSGLSNPSFIGHRQEHLKGTVQLKMTFETKKENKK